MHSSWFNIYLRIHRVSQVTEIHDSDKNTQNNINPHKQIQNKKIFTQAGASAVIKSA
jgi:hypothetical protein